MKIISILLVSFTLVSFSTIDKSSFYEAFESNSQSAIEKNIAQLQKEKQSTARDAYIGALTMKQSQFKEIPKEKLSFFKKGKAMLEAAIQKFPKNGEYRFLRLVIQENTPKILKYKLNIDEDVKIVINTYKSQDAAVKKSIKKYAEKSEHLSSTKLR
jgi:hypothetical protein